MKTSESLLRIAVIASLLGINLVIVSVILVQIGM